MKNIFYRFNIYSLIFIFLFLHVLVIPFPMSDKVFDEAYYTQAGNDLLEGVASNAEHPFLGKLWGSIGNYGNYVVLTFWSLPCSCGIFVVLMDIEDVFMT